MNKFLFIILMIIAGGVVGYYTLSNNINNEKKATVTKENSTDIMENEIKVTPISHATMVLGMAGRTIYIDPVGNTEAFKGMSAPDIILVTDIHGDHLNAETLQAVSTSETVIVAPQAVVDILPDRIPGTLQVLKNGEAVEKFGINILAIPMYNMPESVSAPHTKGRGNGYVLETVGKRVYIAGDTSDIPEMRGLKDIDIAFIPMNLPYTMSVEKAADAVLEFKPKLVHPYHYRGPNGLSDIQKFKELVNIGNPSIKVELLNFYPES